MRIEGARRRIIGRHISILVLALDIGQGLGAIVAGETESALCRGLREQTIAARGM